MDITGHQDQDSAPRPDRTAAPRPTDFLAYSRQYAARMDLDPDVTTWTSEDFEDFLDWWLLGSKSYFSAGDSEA